VVKGGSGPPIENHTRPFRTAQCSKRKFPPYGKRLAEKLHPDVNLIIYAGCNGWTLARARAAVGLDVLLLPPGEDPNAYIWPVRRLHLALIWPDGVFEEVRAFGELLIRQGAARVTAIDRDGTVVFRPLETAA
jgi:hypothetical protein